MRIFVPSAATVLTDHLPHGEGLIAWHLLSGLAARGHEIVACAREVALRTPAPFEIVETGRLTPLESLEPLAQTHRLEREFRRRGGPDRFDVVHWIFPPDLDELAFRPARDIPFVYGPHALSWPVARRSPRLGDLPRAIVRPLLRHRSGRVLRDAALLLFSVPAAMDDLGLDPGGRARILPFGVDAERFHPSPPPSEPTILFVANLEPLKGPGVLLDAFAQLRTPDVRLVVAGAGSLSAILREQARRAGVDERVAWLGRVPHDEIPALMTAASLVCSASVGEPYGMSLLEAMAAGRPVVAFAAGGPTFLVDPRGGRLAWPPGPDALAAALDAVLGDATEAARLGGWNRERVEQEFAWPRVLDRLEALYREAATTHRR